jgi:hypothetical protein
VVDAYVSVAFLVVIIIIFRVMVCGVLGYLSKGLMAFRIILFSEHGRVPKKDLRVPWRQSFFCTLETRWSHGLAFASFSIYLKTLRLRIRSGQVRSESFIFV